MAATAVTSFSFFNVYVFKFVKILAKLSTFLKFKFFSILATCPTTGSCPAPIFVLPPMFPRLEVAGPYFCFTDDVPIWTLRRAYGGTRGGALFF
jgi:hypothetical protein